MSLLIINIGQDVVFLICHILFVNVICSDALQSETKLQVTPGDNTLTIHWGQVIYENHIIILLFNTYFVDIKKS